MEKLTGGCIIETVASEDSNKTLTNGGVPLKLLVSIG